MKPEILTRRFSKLYENTGPKLFGAHMGLSSIDKILLLPVAPPEGTIDRQMLKMKEIFGKDKRFFLGGSLSNNVPNEEIHSYTRKIKNKFSGSFQKESISIQF